MAKNTFDVVTLGFDEYRNPRHTRLEAEKEAAEVARLLKAWGGETIEWDGDMGRGLSAVNSRLRSWSERTTSHSMLLWFGHGRSGTKPNLVVPGDPSSHHDDTFLPANFSEKIQAHLINRNDENGDEWTIILIEACGAQRFRNFLASEIQQSGTNQKIVLIASGKDQGRGYLGDFRRALEGTLHAYGTNSEKISITDLCVGIEQRLSNGDATIMAIGHARPLIRRQLPLEPLSVPMDVFSELRTLLNELPRHERKHFGNSGPQGAFEQWNFNDREHDRTRILRWSEKGSGMIVVTGDAGSGKSALLGNLVLYSRPGIAEALERAGFPNPWKSSTGPFPPLGASLHLAGATLDEVSSRVSRVLDPGNPEAVDSASREQYGRRLLEKLDGRRGTEPLTLLADALDAAEEPREIAEFFQWISEYPGVRVIIGVRTSSEAEGTRSGEHDRSILQALGVGRPHVEVHRMTRDPESIAAFVRHSLESLVTGRSEDRNHFSKAIESVTSRIVDNDYTFLHASLVVREISADPELLDSTRSGDLRDLLSTDQRHLFSAVMDRLTEEHPRVGPALEALAWSRGRGFPRSGRIWERAASALDTSAVSETDLDEVLSVAAPYILTDSEHGQGVYRLAHQAFQEHLLAVSKPGHQAKIARTLLSLADETPEEPLNPYLEHHLSGHLASSDPASWSLLAEEYPQVLDRLHPQAIAADAIRSGGLEPLPLEVIGTIKTAYLAERGVLGDRYGLRTLGMSRTVGTMGPRPADEATQEATWDVEWSHLRPIDPHITLAGHDRAVRALAFVPRGDDEPLLASGGNDGTLRLWNPTTGRHVFPPLPGHQGAVFTATTVPAVGDAAMLVTTGGEAHRAEIRTWRFVSGKQPVSTLLSCDYLFGSATALCDRTGRALVALGGIEGPIFLFDPLEARFLEPSMRRHDGQVTALTALTPHEGAGTRLASGGEDGILRVWEPFSGRHVHSWRAEKGSPVSSLASVEHQGRTWLISGSKEGERGSIRLWLLSWNRTRVIHELHRETQVPAEVTAIAVLPNGGDGRQVALGSADGTLLLWNPFAPQEKPSPLSGHRNRVRAIVAFNAHGTSMLATGGDDTRVRVWPTHRAASSTRAHPSRAEHGLRHAVGDRAPSGDGSPGGPVRSLAPLVFPEPALLVGQGAHLRLHSPSGQDHFHGVWVENASIESLAPYRDQGGEWHLATGVSDGRLFSTRLATGTQSDLIPLFHPPSDAPIRFGKPQALDFWSPPQGQGRLVTGWSDGHVRVWKADDPVAHRLDTAQEGAIRDLGVFTAPHGEPVVAVAANTPRVLFFSLDTGKPWRPCPEMDGHSPWTSTLTVYRSRQGRLLMATGGRDGKVRIWDLATRASVRTVPIGLHCNALCIVRGKIVIGTDQGFLALRLREPRIAPENIH